MLLLLLVVYFAAPRLRVRFLLWAFENVMVEMDIGSPRLWYFGFGQLVRVALQCEDLLVERAKGVKQVKCLVQQVLEFSPGTTRWLDARVASLSEPEPYMLRMDNQLLYRAAWCDVPRLVELIDHPSEPVRVTMINLLKYIYIPKEVEFEVKDERLRRFISGNIGPLRYGGSPATKRERREALARVLGSPGASETEKKDARESLQYVDLLYRIDEALEERRKLLASPLTTEEGRQAALRVLKRLLSGMIGLPLRIRGPADEYLVRVGSGGSQVGGMGEERPHWALLYRAAWCDVTNLLEILEKGTDEEKLTAIWLLERIHIPENAEHGSQRYYPLTPEQMKRVLPMGFRAYPRERREALERAAVSPENSPGVREAALEALMRIQLVYYIHDVLIQGKHLHDPRSSTKQKEGRIAWLLKPASSIMGLELEVASESEEEEPAPAAAGEAERR